MKSLSLLLALCYVTAWTGAHKQYTFGDKCSIPPKVGVDFGSCATLTRFFYSKIFNKCFLFKGCLNPKKNTNNYPTEKECADECVLVHAHVPPPRPVLPSTSTVRPRKNTCYLTLIYGKDYGPCYGSKVTRYYWSTKAMNCLGFQGCSFNGPSNNFRSYESCMDDCYADTVVTTRAPVPVPLDARCRRDLEDGVDFGLCGSAERYYYNGMVGSCTKFLGCPNPNFGSNNFPTERSCIRTCSKKVSTIDLTDYIPNQPPPRPPNTNPTKPYNSGYRVIPGRVFRG